jgi:hypothetical protein
MKLKFLFIALLAVLAAGCMDSVTAVPKAAIDGTANFVGTIWDAITFWDN